MKKNIILIISLSFFTFVLSYGISYANRIITKSNLVSNIEEKEDLGDEEASYNGESYSDIASKINKKYAVDSKKCVVTKDDTEEEITIKDLGEYIAKYSISKGVDPYLIAAIIMVNSNMSTKCNEKVKYCNNVSDLVGGDSRCFGGAYKKYTKLEDSVKDLVDYVSSEFYANDLTKPYDIYKSYDKKIDWAFKVDKYMKNLKK